MLITLKNKKLHDYLLDKDALVKEGRSISVELEVLEKKIQGYENKEKIITSKCEPKELIAEIEALSKEIEVKMKKVDEIAEKIRQEKLAAVPENIKNEHMALLKKRGELENERNKKALAVQKIKDRVIPIIQREVKPFLQDMYEDVETAVPKNGEVLINTFSHLEDWKGAFAKKRK